MVLQKYKIDVKLDIIVFIMIELYLQIIHFDIIIIIIVIFKLPYSQNMIYHTHYHNLKLYWYIVHL